LNPATGQLDFDPATEQAALNPATGQVKFDPATGQAFEPPVRQSEIKQEEEEDYDIETEDYVDPKTSTH
jgi:hypothetical protein